MKCLECNYRSLTKVTLILHTRLYLYNTYTHKNTDTSTSCFKVSTPAHSQAVSRSAHRHIHKLFQGQHTDTFTGWIHTLCRFNIFRNDDI